MTTQAGLPVHDNKGNVVGSISHVAGVLTLYKSLSRVKHMLRIPLGWATDVRHLELLSGEAIKFGESPADARVVIEDERKVRWTATVHEFLVNGFPIDRGYGKQQFLAEKFWRQSNHEQLRLF